MKQSHCSPLCLKDKKSESDIIDDVVIAVTLGGHTFQLWLGQGCQTCVEGL